MQVTVEFLGSASVAAGRKSISIACPDHCRVRELIAALAQAMPHLVGRVIAESRDELIHPNVLDVGGTRVLSNPDEILDLRQNSNFAIGQLPC